MTEVVTHTTRLCVLYVELRLTSKGLTVQFLIKRPG
jgi:hypothetical protein